MFCQILHWHLVSGVVNEGCVLTGIVLSATWHVRICDLSDSEIGIYMIQGWPVA